MMRLLLAKSLARTLHDRKARLLLNKFWELLQLEQFPIMRRLSDDPLEWILRNEVAAYDTWETEPFGSTARLGPVEHLR